jgi:putative transposase
MWESEKKNVSKYDSHLLLPTWKAERPELKGVFSQVLQNAQERIDLAFKAFFRRVKNHENPGYPRFKGKGNYDSFTYPQSGFSVKDNKTLYLSKIGDVKIKIHREIEGQIKRLTVLRTIRNKWYVTFSVEQETIFIPSDNGPVIGIDLGLESFLTFSDGSKVDNPRFFRSEEHLLAKKQSRRDKLPKGSVERKKTTRVIQRIHERITNKRSNFAHQLSHKLVTKYSVVCLEDLNIKSMLRDGTRGLSKSISDASWNLLLRLISYKAESAGSKAIFVDPRNTSQMCSFCGAMVPKQLKDRIHKCPFCGLEMDRDKNAAINILRLGLQSVGKTDLRSEVRRSPIFQDGE